MSAKSRGFSVQRAACWIIAHAAIATSISRWRDRRRRRSIVAARAASAKPNWHALRAGSSASCASSSSSVRGPRHHSYSTMAETPSRSPSETNRRRVAACEHGPDKAAIRADVSRWIIPRNACGRRGAAPCGRHGSQPRPPLDFARQVDRIKASIAPSMRRRSASVSRPACAAYSATASRTTRLCDFPRRSAVVRSVLAVSSSNTKVNFAIPMPYYHTNPAGIGTRDPSRRGVWFAQPVDS